MLINPLVFSEEGLGQVQVPNQTQSMRTMCLQLLPRSEQAVNALPDVYVTHVQENILTTGGLGKRPSRINAERDGFDALQGHCRGFDASLYKTRGTKDIT